MKKFSRGQILSSKGSSWIDYNIIIQYQNTGVGSVIYILTCLNNCALDQIVVLRNQAFFEEVLLK